MNFFLGSVILFNILFSARFIYAQEQSNLKQSDSLNNLIVYSNLNQLESFQKPNRLIDNIFESEQELLFTVLSATTVTGILFLTDDKAYNSVNKIPSYTLVGKINPIVTEMGHGNFSLALFGTFGLHHLFTKNEKSWEVAKLGTESFLASGILVQILKNCFGRERPSHATIEGGKWHGFASAFAKKNKGKSIANFDSFPSGHTATAFSAATILSFVYPDGAVPYISYFCAGVVAFTRVTESTHWFSDCFIGALIGYYTAKMVIGLNHGNSNFNLNFGLVNNGAGVIMQLKL